MPQAHQHNKMEDWRLHPQQNIKRAVIYSLIICLLYALQHPLSVPAAKDWSWLVYIFNTELIVALSIPLLLWLLPRQVSQDYRQILSSRYHLKRLPIFFGLSIIGALCYCFGLRSAPVPVVAVIMNISPLWAALSDRLIIGTKKLTSTFLGMFVAAFVGILISVYFDPQYANDLHNLNLSVSWLWAVPVPVLYAVNGTLVGKWFQSYHHTSSVLATFTVSAPPIVFILGLWMWLRYVELDFQWSVSPQPLIMFVVGTVAATVVARLLYQAALKEAGNDNGFVSMFFSTIPFITLIVADILGVWVESLRQSLSIFSIVGMLITVSSVAIFSMRRTGQP